MFFLLYYIAAGKNGDRARFRVVLLYLIRWGKCVKAVTEHDFSLDPVRLWGENIWCAPSGCGSLQRRLQFHFLWKYYIFCHDSS